MKSPDHASGGVDRDSLRFVTEPVPDPLADALRLRASDADRERVAGLLREAYVEGRLSAVEHEERVSEVYKATTYAELVPLLHDLPVPPGSLSVPGVGQAVALTSTTLPAVPGRSGVVIDPSRADSGQGVAVAIMSGVERKGGWVLPPTLTTVAVMGGVEMDLTNAILTSQETVMTVVALMGGIEITVPDGIDVRMDVFAFMGGQAGPKTPAPPGAPILRIRGLAIMGGVEVSRAKAKPELEH
jgi:hypothetical protein